MCVSPHMTVAVIFPASLLLTVFYGILNHGPLKKYQIKEIHQRIEYAAVPEPDGKMSKQKVPYLLGRLQFLRDVFPLCGYFFVCFCSYYLAVGSVLTTLTFQNSPFRVRDHYHYYKITGDIGMVLGSCELMVVSCLCPGFINVFRIRRLWIFIPLNVGHLMFFLFAAWYHFVANIYILLVLCATHGLVFGLTCVHVFVAAANRFESTHEKGLALNITELGSSLGKLVSGMLGIFVEAYLRQHCTNNMLMGKYCLARFSSSVGWNNNLECK